MILDSPYPTIANDYHSSSRRWREVSEDDYTRFRESLTPISVGYGCFLSGEPYTHTDQGEAVFAAFIIQDDRFYSQLMTLKEFKVSCVPPIAIGSTVELNGDRVGRESGQFVLKKISEYEWEDVASKHITVLTDRKVRRWGDVFTNLIEK